MFQDCVEPLHGDQRPHLVPAAGDRASADAAAGLRRAAPLSAAQQRLRHEPQHHEQRRRQRQEDLRERRQEGRLYDGSFMASRSLSLDWVFL